MKDFIEWLGVNEKIAKLVVWIFIIFVMLILTNAMLDSIGFPHYQITYQNIKQIKTNKIFNTLVGWLLVISNFYCIILLIFPINKYKSILPYGLLYLLLNVILTRLTNFAIIQIFIIGFIILFSYYYSNKNKKYILYSIISIIINIVIEGLVYNYKAKVIKYSNIEYINQAILFIDYFIIMGVIILVKEIYIKKRRDKECGEDIVYSGSENSKMKAN